ncbi:MAG: hypothetical protein KZQ85_07055 [Candidatus Thiodiazotropha sp. (ex Myrtea sp. 'scaly one' KF741663)]|nr:hypothetical protein [Candidatus Thiodiazotropha sp. (ex Myrtea sp. 'scaly one' KF741663)]
MLTRRHLILFVLSTLPVSAVAEKGRSIMFEPPENMLDTPAQSETQSQGEKCQDLLRKIEELKGKPQRKHAAMTRYDQECATTP